MKVYSKSKGGFTDRREEFPSLVVLLHKAEEGVSIIFPPLYVCVLHTKLRAGGGAVVSAAQCAVMLRPVLPPHLDINILSRVHQLINSCDI